ncbi:hypothetical protein B0H14DRAFT_2578149 [Mycena olivaceomarginata]|nr:hypothetical protein B0H14DRAFT_2578149 [Mycena olivaceomarginata]
MSQIQDILLQLNDHRLKAYFLIESIDLWRNYPISYPEALTSQVVELFKDFDDPDLKCRFYFNMTEYYLDIKNDFGGAANMCNKLISLATQTGNTRGHCRGLLKLAIINIHLGTYSVAQMNAHKSQKLSRVSGNLWGEAHAFHMEAICWKELGHYKQSLFLSIRAQSLLSLWGMSDSYANFGIMNAQAEVHKCKSEYSKAWKIYAKLLQISTNRNAYGHALASLNLAEIAVSIGVEKHVVQRNIDLARSTFTTQNLKLLGKGSTSSKETIQKVFEIGHRTE